jgi:flagellar hook assembly protein FlgD
LLLAGLSVAVANVFPSYIRITQDYSKAPFDGSFADGTGAAIRFFLNQVADSVQVGVIPAAGGAPIATITKYNLGPGDNAIYWDGTTAPRTPAPAGQYKFVVTAYHGGFSAYTQIDYWTSNLSFIFTRGVTDIKNPALRWFGFIYTVSRGGYVTGLARHAADGSQYGFKPDSAFLATTGVALPGSGNNISYAPTADTDGYVYVIKFDDHTIYRFHVDTLAVALFDTSLKGGIGMGVKGLNVRGTGAAKTLYVTGDSSVFSIQIGTQDFNTAPPTKLVTVGSDTGKRLFFWDATVGEDNSLYVVYRADSAIGTLPVHSRGILKFDLNTGTLPKRLADTVWTARMADGDPVTIALWDGPTPSGSDDILYLSHDVGTPNTELSGLYAFTNLTAAAPTRAVAWADPDNNASSSRSTVINDVVGNLVYFENSNEQVVLVSPPSGPNSYTLTSLDTLTITNAGFVWPLVTIGGARIDANKDGQPDRRYDTLRVIGVINSVNIQTTNFGYFMQDSTGGLEIFKSGLVGAPAIKPGDRVMVKGFVDYYRGTTEITPQNLATDITVLDTGNAITPFVLTIGQYKANAEFYESRRIQLTLAQPIGFGPSTWPAAGVAVTDTIWNGIDTCLLRLDSDTEIPGSAYPAFPVKLTGVASQFTTSASVHLNGYQITPIYNSDFVPINAPPVAKFALLSPPNGSTLNVDTSSTSTYKFTWQAALDFNNDALIYQFQPVGKAGSGADSSGKATAKTYTSAQLRTLMGTADTLVLRWTVLAKDPTNPAVANLDTFTVTLKKVFVGVEDENGIPATYQLSQNYPNPFNPSTTIRFGLPMQSTVTLRIYDILGREVQTLLQDTRPAGYHSVVWDGRDRNGNTAATGVYFFRIEARPVDNGAPFTSLKKMMLVK